MNWRFKWPGTQGGCEITRLPINRPTRDPDSIDNSQPVSDAHSCETSRTKGRVLIAAPAFRDYGRIVGRAFELEGWKAHVFEHSDPDMSFLQAAKWTASQRYRLLREADSMSRYNREFQRLICTQNPDICLIINGNLIYKQTIGQIRQVGARSILWCYDSVTRYPRILESISEYDQVHVFEPTDVPILSSLGIEASVLPMAYDSTLYSPAPAKEEKYDLAFVGTVFSYPDRLRFLKRVVSKNHRLRIRIITNTPPLYSPRRSYRLLRPFSPFLRTIEMRSMSHSQINEIYNSSKICLNHHHGQSREGLNPRVFEILGSGAFQLVDQKRQLSDLFEVGKEIVSYHSEEDLQKQIEYFLENSQERIEIARRGEGKVRSMHTYRSRVKRLLRVLNL